MSREEMTSKFGGGNGGGFFTGDSLTATVFIVRFRTPFGLVAKLCRAGFLFSGGLHQRPSFQLLHRDFEHLGKFLSQVLIELPPFCFELGHDELGNAHREGELVLGKPCTEAGFVEDFVSWNVVLHLLGNGVKVVEEAPGGMSRSW